MTLPLLDLIERVQAHHVHIQLQDKLPAELRQAGWELWRVGRHYKALQFAHRIVTEEHLTLDDCLAMRQSSALPLSAIVYAYCYLLELLPVSALHRIEAQFPAAPMLPDSFKHLLRKLERKRT
jgi:hypothetical protein